MGNQDRLSYLMERYRTNTCTRAELDELFELLHPEDESESQQHLHAQWEEAAEKAPTDSSNWDKLFGVMMEQARDLEMEIPPSPFMTRRRSRRRKRMLFASICLVVFLGGSGLFIQYFSGPRTEISAVITPNPRFKNDVQPGGNKATLTLSDGSSIALDSAVEGTLSTQGHSRVLKLANGRLAYRSASGGDGRPIYNTVSTPRGGQYQVELPDGSKVWLDAGSSLRFPTVFTGKEREVQVSGEAFFEVSDDARHPFLVTVYSREPGKSEALQKVRVLGTQFNVMAYDDEKWVKTTLVEGGVRIDDNAAVATSARSSFELKPGEQAQLTRDHGIGTQVVGDADVDAAVAWKNGYFNFNKVDIQTIMRQISRWYDVEVSFRGDAQKDRVFFGGIQRDLPLSSIIRILERSGVRFSIDGRKVVVDL